jgi:hypothetical protein
MIDLEKCEKDLLRKLENTMQSQTELFKHFESVYTCADKRAKSVGISSRMLKQKYSNQQSNEQSQVIQ